MTNKNPKPRNIPKDISGYYKGCEHRSAYIEKDRKVSVRIWSGDPKEIRQIADWLNRAADWIESKRCAADREG